MRYRIDGPLLSVNKPQQGAKYHVSWGRSNGVVGVCISVDENSKTVVLKSPKTGKVWNCTVKWSDLRHIRKNQVKNPH